MIVRAVAGTALLLLALSLGLAVGVPAALADSSPVLVIVAHPDDETLGAAGVIQSVAAGRPVYVAVVTNGATAGSAGSSSTAVCGAATGTPSGVALLGLTRERESEAAMTYLGGGTSVGTGSIPWTNSLVSTHVFFLGYPDGGGTTSQGIAGISQGLSVSDDAGIGTYADSGDSTNHNCNGDYHFLVHGSHGSFTQASLQGDISDVIDQVRPGDIYTHVVFDGHPDHAAVARDVLQAVQTLGLTTTVHGTLIHHLEQAGCLAASAWFWPNPEQVSDPAARATPDDPFLAPPLFAGAPSSHCPASTSDTPVGSDWGPWGAPNEIDPVPADMALTDLTQNHKWQAISKYHTQMSGCPANVASCGYLYAFIKSDEFFWSYSFGAGAKPAPLSWPTISGTGHAVGSMLTPNLATAADGTWANAPTGYAYQWVRCDPVGELASCSDIAGATGPGAYMLVNADAGSTLRIKVTASNGNGSTTIWSEPTDVITGGGGSPPVNTVAPAISGSTVSGQVLSVSNGTWTGSPAPGFSYQWQRCDSAGANCVAIGGATSQTYTLVAADVGHTMRAVVTGSNSAGSSAATSAATGVVTGGGGGGGSGTFGVTSVGTLTDAGGGGFLDLSGPFVVGQAVSVSKLTAYLGGGSSASKLRGVIYADSGGAPGALVGTSNELSIAAGAAAGWVDLTLPSSLSLPAGSYWLGYWYADGNGRHYYVDAAGAERYAPAAYSSTNPAPASFGAASTSTSNYSIYASYTIP
ncbi:MAG: PIG-L family deacetylase [Solirubrobacteraceae bacterium]